MNVMGTGNHGNHRALGTQVSDQSYSLFASRGLTVCSQLSQFPSRSAPSRMLRAFSLGSLLPQVTLGTGLESGESDWRSESRDFPELQSHSEANRKSVVPLTP